MINKTALADELTEAFIGYQWRLDHPFPAPDISRQDMITQYQCDQRFHSKVQELTSGVMHIVSKHT